MLDNLDSITGSMYTYISGTFFKLYIVVYTSKMSIPFNKDDYFFPHMEGVTIFRSLHMNRRDMIANFFFMAGSLTYKRTCYKGAAL